MASEVSVVIPTTLRDLTQLDRAISSAADQTPAPLEVVVVVDDPDVVELPEISAAVPVRVLRNGAARGPGGARNFGFTMARGSFVALLDDDDYWLPGKLEVQLSAVEALPEKARHAVVVASRGYLMDEGLKTRAPLLLPEPGQRLVSYLYEPSRIRRPDRLFHTSSLVVSRSLAMAHPFRELLRGWEDVEWLLRLTDVGGRLVYCPEVLIVYNRIQSGRPSLSRMSTADNEDEWARRFLQPRSVRAFHNFRLTHVTRRLIDEGRRKDALRLGRESLRTRMWHASSAAEHLAFVVLSASQRSALRNLRRVANRAFRSMVTSRKTDRSFVDPATRSYSDGTRAIRRP